jgi:hypothetical protein
MHHCAAKTRHRQRHDVYFDGDRFRSRTSDLSGFADEDIRQVLEQVPAMIPSLAREGGLSDRLVRTESEFFHNPHTTRILWGGHRVVYIFTEATGRLNLYYDIELRKPIDQSRAGGGMFRTTTLITKNRIFVSVPGGLQEEFKVATGPKEFFVRFDVLSSPGQLRVELRGCPLIPPRGNPTNIGPLNALIQSNYAANHCDALADYWSDAHIGNGSNIFNTTYFYDGLHLTILHYGIMAAILAPQINLVD